MTRKFKPITDGKLGKVVGGVSPLFITGAIYHGLITTDWVMRKNKSGEKIRIKDFAKAAVGFE